MHCVHRVVEPTDLDRLNEIISEILGATCWRANLSYGDELILNIGDRLPYSQPSMAGREKGAWMLGTRASAWRIHCPMGTLASSDEDPDALKQKLHYVEGTSVTEFNTGFPDLALTVNFANGCALRVFSDTAS